MIHLVITGLLLLSSNISYAAEWSVKGNVAQSFGYDDNVRMSPTAPQGSFEYKIIPTIRFQHRTESTEVIGNASYGTQLYTDIPELDQDIQKYGVKGLYKTERIDWGMGFDYSVLPTRNNANEESGDFATVSSNTTWALNPLISYKLSEIDSLVFTPSYRETTFQNTTASSFRNSDTKSVNLAWQRQWTELYSSSLSAFYTNFESERGSDSQGLIPSTFNSTGINFSNSYTWIDNWRLTGGIGVRHTESNNPQQGTNTSSFGFLANAGINYNAESYVTALTFSRSLIPSNFGQLQEQTGVNWHFTYRIDERLTTSLDTGYQNSTLVNEDSSIERDNLLVQPAVNWMVTPDWKLTGSYRFRTQDLSRSANSVTTSDSNMFMLSINYNWPGFNLSR
jgi:OMPG-porin 1 family